MGSASSTELEQDNRVDSTQSVGTNPRNNTNQPTTTEANQQATIEQSEPSSFQPTQIMTTSINEENTTNNQAEASTSSSPSPAAQFASSVPNRPPTSPSSAAPQPIDLSGANSVPYRIERTDTLNTVRPNQNDVNITVQTDSHVLRQRSKSQDLAVSPSVSRDVIEEKPSTTKKGSKGKNKGIMKEPSVSSATCINPPSEINGRLDTQVEVRVYPCNNSSNDRKKKFTQFMVKPEGVIIQGTNKNRTANNDLGAEYANYIGRKLQRYELSDTRACQLLVTTHHKSYWVVPAPEAFSRHSGTCRLLGDRKHAVANHTLQVGDFLRVGSVGVVVIETHNGEENRILSEEKIQKIMKDTTNSNNGFLDLGETDGENSDDSMSQGGNAVSEKSNGDSPVCYMCFDDEDTDENPLITPCKCKGDTRYVHVNCLRKWHTAEADNQICFLSSVDATCSVCKTTFKSDFKLRDGRLVKLFKSSLEPPYVSLLVATKHEMAQRLFNTRFQLSFSTLMKPDGRNATRPLLLGRSSGSDMVLDYRTVSARHATIRFKNGEFIFTDAASSNGSYLYLRRPVELTPSQPVQFRLGRSMISMKVVNKWNKRLFRAVRRSGHSASSNNAAGNDDDHSVGSNEEDVRITDGRSGAFTSYLPRRSRESIIESMPEAGKLAQTSPQHLDLLYALAYPKKSFDKNSSNSSKRREVVQKDSSNRPEESKAEEDINPNINSLMAGVSISPNHNGR